MTVTLKVIGVDHVTKRYRRIALEQLDEMGKALAISGLELQGQCRALISRGARSGKQRKKGGRSSAPGEPPKTDTGRLVSNIFSILASDRQSVEVGTDINYGRFLEFGTSKMAARPWLHPTYQKIKPRIEERLRRAFKKANRDAAQ